MTRRNAQSPKQTIARKYLEALDRREIANRYSQAVMALADVAPIADHFEAAADAAIYHSEKARAHRSKAVIETKVSQKNWKALSNAALRLSKEFQINDYYTHVRIAHALRTAGLDLEHSQYKKLHKFIINLARQTAEGFGRTELIVGPLRITNPGRRQLSLPNALTICLAHTFHSISNNRLNFLIGETIEKGMAWDVATDFAQAALSSDQDASPAKKALSEHRGKLVFNGWRRVTVGKQK